MPNAQVVYLICNRKLDPLKESDAVLLNENEIKVDGWKTPDKLPQDENELAQFIWSQFKTPKKCQVYPTFKENRFPTINDKIKSGWTYLSRLAKRKTISVIFVSSNPYIPYQRENIIRWMRQGDSSYRLYTQIVAPAS